jgi:dihydroorotate dehydrogenase
MNLTTTYLGLTLKHPVVASASPLSKELDGIKRLEDAGAAAIVMHSLFEEQITAQEGGAAPGAQQPARSAAAASLDSHSLRQR